MAVTYRQTDPRWASYPCSIGTISNYGCGPTACATIIYNSVNTSVSPITTNEYANAYGYVIAHVGTSFEGMVGILNHWNVQAKVCWGSDSWFAELDKGNRWCILSFTSGTQGGVAWANNGHYVAATAYKKENGKHYLYTRDPNGVKKNDGWHCFETTMSNLCTAIIICYSDTQPNKFTQLVDVGDAGPEGITGTYDVGTIGNSTTNTTSQPIEVVNGNVNLSTQVKWLYSQDNYEFIKTQESSSNSNRSNNSLISIFKNAFESLNKNLSHIGERNAVNYVEASNVLGQNATPSDVLLEATRTANLYSKSNGIKVTPKNASKVATKGTLISSNNQLPYSTSVGSAVIQAPFILLSFNGVTVGGYGNQGDVYPNYITSMSISKINGKINKYQIQLLYTIRLGEDPNFIDKLLSRTGFQNKLKIVYGDSVSNIVFRDDEAVITDVTFSEAVSSHQISYSITALSSIVSTTGLLSNYASATDKPSNLINELLYSTSEVSRALLKSLPGMINKELVYANNLIPTDDTVVTTIAQTDVSSYDMLNYYVSGMYDAQGNTYTLSYHDDTKNKYGGAYLSIDKISATSTETLNGKYFEINVGYPDDNLVLDFRINTDTYFPLIYKYNDNFKQWDYEINNEGKLEAYSTNSLLSKNQWHRKNVVQSNWWKQVTEYPVTASIVLRGLSKPIMLMSYIKINVLFYGNQDLANGLYVVTGQTDSISGNGYTTTLDLLRVGQE